MFFHLVADDEVSVSAVVFLIGASVRPQTISLNPRLSPCRSRHPHQRQTLKAHSDHVAQMTFCAAQLRESSGLIPLKIKISGEAGGSAAVRGDNQSPAPLAQRAHINSSK
ncbi:hypothetical protein IAQ61_011904 [Plenodomus lingam]|uniref:uncharacterized protein n=1 Tax=Leptosphaeria maculans TaxID=5022 RepID=UPI003321CE06|nr:hypothetical protein IAQ61_011904 [Plenodomus lingam]